MSKALKFKPLPNKIDLKELLITCQNELKRVRDTCKNDYPFGAIILNSDVYTNPEADEPRLSFKKLGLTHIEDGRAIQYNCILIRKYWDIDIEDLSRVAKISTVGTKELDDEGETIYTLRVIINVQHYRDLVPCVSYDPHYYLKSELEETDPNVDRCDIPDEELSKELKNLLLNVKANVKGQNVFITQNGCTRRITSINDNRVYYDDNVKFNSTISNERFENLLNLVVHQEKDATIEYIASISGNCVNRYKRKSTFFKKYWVENGIRKVGYTMIWG